MRVCWAKLDTSVYLIFCSDLHTCSNHLLAAHWASLPYSFVCSAASATTYSLIWGMLKKIPLLLFELFELFLELQSWLQDTVLGVSQVHTLTMLKFRLSTARPALPSTQKMVPPNCPTQLPEIP